jgi:ComF family protein
MDLRRLLASAADLVWAPRCAACDSLLSPTTSGAVDAAFCAACAISLEPVGSPRCPRCGLAFDGEGGDHLCGRCLERPPAFASLDARYAYGGGLADAIARFKYGRAHWLAAPLGSLLFDGFAPTGRLDVIAPVPLHPRRLRDRGFNQSALLASYGTRALGVPLDTGLLRRVADTPHQAGTTAAQRARALDGAFIAAHPRRLAGARVLLVDDVATTTATARTAAAVLRAAGAAEIRVLCLARAM